MKGDVRDMINKADEGLIVTLNNIASTVGFKYDSDNTSIEEFRALLKNNYRLTRKESI